MRTGVKNRRKGAVPVGDLIAPALRTLGLPSARLTRRIRDAWAIAVDPAWGEDTVPLRLVGGVLVVGVRSASLRQELAQFHRNRLLSVLKAALPDVSLVAVRFTAETGDGPDASSQSMGDR